MKGYDQNTKVESRKQELVKLIKSRNYHFYSTLTFTNRLCDETIIRKMEDFSKDYLIDEVLWFREFTSDGKPHIHMVIQVNNIPKGQTRLSYKLKQWGNTHFEPYDNQQSENCISYISKEYGKPNCLWGI